MAYSSIVDVLYQLEGLGFFDFLLPFLLIFAVIFGILEATHIFGADNKPIRMIIAIVLGFLSIRLPFFSAFLSEITPRLGVGITILLAAMILVGLFTQKKSTSTVLWILFGVGAAIFLVILVQSANALSYFGYGSGFFSDQVI